MGTKGKLLIIALLMSGIVALLVWSKNGTPKKASPAVGSANKGAVDESPSPDDPNSRPGPDSGDRYHLPPDDPASGDGTLRVETADNNGSRTPPAVNQDSHPEVVRPAPPATAARTYKVEPGDSLAKIATKIYGKETAWKLIYDANKDKMSSPDDLLRVGTALVIPAGAPENKPPANDIVTAPKNDPPKDVVKNDPPKESPKVDAAKKTYKVKAGDTLSSIAKALLGDSNKWKAIYLANKEKLPHPDTLIEGMELSIP